MAMNHISRLGVVGTITKPLKFYLGNYAVFFFKNDKHSIGDKHIELKYFAVKENVQKQSLCTEHIRTELVLTDPLTRGFQPKA